MGGICCGPSEVNDIEIEGGGGPAVVTKDSAGRSPRTPAAPVPASATASGANSGGLTFASVLDNLEEAEQMVYGTSFQSFNAGSPVPYTDDRLKDFVATSTSLNFADMDGELVRVVSGNADGDLQVNLDNFLSILRDNAVSESAALERFLGLASGADDVDSGECRTGLLMFSNDFLGPQAVAISQDRWDQIFDSVMSDAGPTVSMEGWTNYVKRVARIIRVAHAARL